MACNVVCLENKACETRRF